MPLYQFIILLVVLLLSSLITLFLLARLILMRKKDAQNTASLVGSAAAGAVNAAESRLDVRIDSAAEEHARDIEQLRSSLSDSMSTRLDALSLSTAERSEALGTLLETRQASFEKAVTDKQDGLEKHLSFKQDTLNFNVGEKLTALDGSLKEIRETLDRQLDSIRGIVNEKLQQTLNERLGESFRRVEERLGEVYKGLGEMSAIASGVGDLKKVLSNVKTRGTLGEIQLHAILEEVLAPEQYVVNFDAGKGGSERVEFAIRMPNDGASPVFLPIDSKFPVDKYIQLNDAYDSGDPAAVEAAQKALRESLTKFAKDISDKYINPPLTTNFAIMFLPTEGLYAEAVRLGMVELLQSRFRINIAGPSTMAALLNSLQMGFRTLAIQKRSSEVWELLAKIKKEFDSFDAVLENTRKALSKANEDLDKLVGTRTRKIRSALNRVEQLPDGLEMPSGHSASLIDADSTDDAD